MTAEQRKAIFGISKGLGMSNDELHIMVNGLTGCESLKDLDDKQTDIVLRELRYRNRGNKSGYPQKDKEEIYPGKMTAEQRGYARGLMRKLQRLDEKPRLHENGKPYTTEERLAGAINKILGITAMPNKRVFDWLTVEEGSKLIEGLKRYVKSAERKAEKRKNDNGLHDAEYEHMPHKTFPNYALMKVSAYHKSIGDHVEWWNPLDNGKYDRVYSSKVFDFTPETPYLPSDTIKGGTGYGIFSELPEEIDNMFPDYSIYPGYDYAIGFLTKGCPNKCPWCYVPQKEGNIRSYRTWQQLVRPDIKKLVLMDNNILACPHGIQQLSELAETDYRIDLNQGMDVRLLTDEICEILKKIHWIRFIRFSCDTAAQLPFFRAMVEMFDKHKISKSRVFVYLLVRDDLEEADRRVQELNKLCRNFNIYAQAERNEREGIVPNATQLEFTQRYVYGRCYKSETWHEYCRRKGFD